MARHEYLAPGDVRRRPAVSVMLVVLVVGTWFVLSALIIWGDHTLFAAMIGLIAVVLGVRIRSALRPDLVREIHHIQLERLREHIPEAIQRCRALLRKGVPPHTGAALVTILGQCAEMEGDFPEAAALFVQAEGMLRATRMNGVARAQQLAIVAAHRAFAHAACGDLDRAQATLATAGVKDGVPLAGALSSRALLLILARRGLKQQVLERLALDGKLLRNGLAFRDRTLVAVIGAYARSRNVPRDSVDPVVRSWIERAFPEAQA